MFGSPGFGNGYNPPMPVFLRFMVFMELPVNEKNQHGPARGNLSHLVDGGTHRSKAADRLRQVSGSASIRPTGITFRG
jgi:hypothetical protein